MTDFWRIFFMLNLSIFVGGGTLFFIKKWLGRINHYVSVLMLTICLVSPVLGYINPVLKIQKAKFSAQEYLDLTLNPPVLPGEGNLKPLPVFTQTLEASSELLTIDWINVLKKVFYLGVIFFLGSFFSRYIYLQYLLSKSDRFKKYKHVRILIGEKVSSPFSTLFGLYPVIVLPKYLINKKEYKWVLRHEFQHIRQGDVYLNLLLEILKAFCFFNPMIWWWIKDLKESMEFSCDEQLTKKFPTKKKEYAYALLEVAEKSLELNVIKNLCAGMASLGREEQQILSRRIKMIAKKKKMNSKHVVFSVGLLTVVSTFAFASGIPPLNLEHDNLPQDVSSEVKELLVKGVKGAHAKQGYVVITRPKTGEVLYAKGFSREGKDLNDDFLSVPYSPWSLMKPLLTALAIDKKATLPSSLHSCENGKLKIGKKSYRDYKPFKFLTTEDALVKSSNVCNIKVSQKLSNKELIVGLESFGFGKGSIVEDYPSASKGILRKYQGENKIYQAPNLVIGYHAIFTTPLELSQAYGALLNDGILHSPTQKGNTALSRRIITSKTASALKSMLRKVVTNGTGQRAKDSLLEIGGKTASSPGAPYDFSARVSFIGAAPIGNPEFL
ncbi:MAG: hypothetical protein HON90_13505, partial [Halobacteriovoraceae bacterium]|nr:hypothetical protein [Halobacteriovoraceae bacterium]